MPRLRVLAGPSPDRLTPIAANDGAAYPIRSEHFEGRVVVYIKGLDGAARVPEYFQRADRAGVTWSIQVQGRFLQSHSADDILFGNTFDRPLKLPWGSSAALKFMHFIDPTLEHDLGSSKPWALSPLVSTMPYFAHAPAAARHAQPFPARASLVDDTSALLSARASADGRPLNLGPPGKRRSHFSSRANRAAVSLGPADVVTTDFCYGFLSFPALSLNLPGGISFDCMKYWDGQPVRFVCCERAGAASASPASSRSGSSSSLDSGSGSAPCARAKGPGTTFWCVVFEVVPDGEADESEESEEDDVD